jgi:hypothetical protein
MSKKKEKKEGEDSTSTARRSCYSTVLQFPKDTRKSTYVEIVLDFFVASRISNLVRRFSFQVALQLTTHTIIRYCRYTRLCWSTIP